MSKSLCDRGMAMTYLESLFSIYASGFIETRYIRGRQVRRGWIHLPYDLRGRHLKEHVDYICDMADTGWDCYVGVNPRNEITIASTKENIIQSGFVYIDLDDKLGDVSVTMLADCDVVVHSGNGFHGYKSIGRVVPMTTKKDRTTYEDKMRAWANSIHEKADPVFDCTRVLRVAGTINWKDADNPKPVQLIKPESAHTFRAKEKNEWAPYFDDPMLNKLLRLAKKDKLGRAEPRILLPSGRHIDDLDCAVIGLWQGIREFEEFGIRGYRVDMATQDIPFILAYFKNKKEAGDE